MLHKKIYKLKIKLFFVFTIVLFLFASSFSYVKAVSEHLSTSVLRLHVVANSDNDFDQALKYKVRDSLLKYMNTLCDSTNTKSDAINIVKSNLNNFKLIAEQTIHENGYNYPVNIQLGNFYFPSKDYGDISFPAGMYDALKVEIGNASGHNWWCVMFPPLCFVDVTSGVVPDSSKEELQDNLSEDEFNLISSNDDFYQFKFKLVELFNSMANNLTG